MFQSVPFCSIPLSNDAFRTSSAFSPPTSDLAFLHPFPRLIHTRTLELSNFRTSPSVLLPTARPLQTLKRSQVSNAHTSHTSHTLTAAPLHPCFSLLLIPRPLRPAAPCRPPASDLNLPSVHPPPRLIHARTVERAHFRTSPVHPIHAVHSERITANDSLPTAHFFTPPACYLLLLIPRRPALNPRKAGLATSASARSVRCGEASQ